MEEELLEENSEDMIAIPLGDEPGGAEEEPGAAEEGAEGGAEDQGEEEPGEDGAEGQGGEEMSMEKRHRQAFGRRAREEAAREEAARAAAHQAEIDAVYAKAYAGQLDPYHGHKPIRTEQDYLAYIDARRKEEQRQSMEAMKDHGVDPELLQQLIDDAVKENPAVKQAGAAVQQANAAMEAAKAEQTARQVEQEMAVIRTLDPTIKTADDLHEKYPDSWDRTLELCRKGVSLSEAFKIANFDALLKSKGAAIRQGEKNLRDSKAHLKNTKNSNQSTVTMPRAVLEEFRRINPGKSDAEYAAFYLRQHKDK